MTSFQHILDEIDDFLQVEIVSTDYQIDTRVPVLGPSVDGEMRRPNYENRSYSLRRKVMPNPRHDFRTDRVSNRLQHTFSMFDIVEYGEWTLSELNDHMPDQISLRNSLGTACWRRTVVRVQINILRCVQRFWLTSCRLHYYSRGGTFPSVRTVRIPAQFTARANSSCATA